jgi:anti-anti-sigma factor
MLETQSTDTGLLARLAGDLNIYRAAEFQQALSSLLEQPESLELDLSGVSEIDSSGVQLLLLLRRERENTGYQTRFVNHSDAVLDVFQLMDLAGHFNDPIVYPRNRAEDAS